MDWISFQSLSAPVSARDQMQKLGAWRSAGFSGVEADADGCGKDEVASEEEQLRWAEAVTACHFRVLVGRDRLHLAWQTGSRNTNCVGWPGREREVSAEV